MAPGVLAEFEPIYRVMGAHGWAPGEVDAMEPWQVASFLGVGGEGIDPVLRGTRDGLRLPSERADDGAAVPGPRARQVRETGRLLTGSDAT